MIMRDGSGRLLASRPAFLLASIGDYRNFPLGGGNCWGKYAIPCFGTPWNHRLRPRFDSVTPHNPAFQNHYIPERESD